MRTGNTYDIDRPVGRIGGVVTPPDLNALVGKLVSYDPGTGAVSIVPTA